MAAKEHRIGVISDTHGVLRPEAVEALRGSERIIHAGDVGEESILRQLRSIAPLDVVRGNVDIEPWAQLLPDTHVVEVGGVAIYVLHDLEYLDLDPVAAAIGVVIYGHSHRPKAEERDGVLYLNPGSAGPRRFTLPVTVATLHIENGAARATIEEIVR